MRIRNYVILLSVLVSSLRVHCAKLLPISIMFIFWILFLHSFLTFLTTLSPRLYFTFTIMVPFAVFALGIFCFRFLFCLWPFSHSQFLLMEKWQLNMDKHLSYALELERAAAWGRNLMSVILWGLCAKFGIRNSSRSSINIEEITSCFVSRFSLIAAPLFKKTTQIIEGRLMHTIRIIL